VQLYHPTRAGPTSQDFEGDSVNLPFLNLVHCQPGRAPGANHISVIQSQGNVREAGSTNIFPNMCSIAESFKRRGVLRKPMWSYIIRQAGPTSQDFEGDYVTSPFMTLVHYQSGLAPGVPHVSVIRSQGNVRDRGRVKDYFGDSFERGGLMRNLCATVSSDKRALHHKISKGIL
jgi:hypothetical protein